MQAGNGTHDQVPLDRLHQRREYEELSRAQSGRHAHVGVQTISEGENRTRRLSLRIRERLARGFNVNSITRDEDRTYQREDLFPDW